MEFLLDVPMEWSTLANFFIKDWLKIHFSLPLESKKNNVRNFPSFRMIYGLLTKEVSLNTIRTFFIPLKMLQFVKIWMEKYSLTNKEK